jgi:PAS domain S-box-containing protein
MALNTPHLRLNVCENATAALGLLKDSSFEVVFTDIMMPGIDGFGMVAQMRKLPGHARTPVVYVTALSDFETRAKSVLSGGCDIIAKPFSASEVVIKALTIGLKHRLDTEAQAAAATPVQAPAEEPKAPVKKRRAVPMSPDKAVMCLEDSWRITTANRDTKVIFGYEAGEVLGQPLTLLLPDELQKEAGAHTLEFLLNQSPLPHGAFQMAGRHKNETKVPVLVSFSETKTQRGRAYVCLIRRDQTMETPPEETEAVEEPVSEPAPANEPSPAPSAEPPLVPTQTEVLEESLGDMAERLGVLESQLAITQAAFLEAQAALTAHAQAAAAAPVVPAEVLPDTVQTPLEASLRRELAELRSRMNLACAQGETLNSRVLAAMSAMEAARQDAASLLTNLSSGTVPPKSQD